MTAPDTLPEAWRGQLPARLESGEQLIAWLEIDLDDRLDFRPGLVALTNLRLVAFTEDYISWPLTAAVRLVHHDHAGVGTL
ncbi:MAG: ABC transporter, partial [Rhodocyclaceae bacterium]|nr:ABC transporter [Rhodocyclaceae bacterium]